jgi:hypothetical protein
MTYDVTIITVRPGTHPDALLRLQQQASEVAPAGELLACWYSELGALNQILLIRSCDEEARLVAQRAAMLQSKNPFGLAEFIVGMTMDMYVSFPFMPPIAPGRYVARLGARPQHRLSAARGDVQRDRAGDPVHAYLALREPRRTPTAADEGGGGRRLAAARRS